MKRSVMVSLRVEDKLGDLTAFLRDELKFFGEAALAYKRRFLVLLASLGNEVDYALCRFKRWHALGYRCVVFERGWVIAYEIVPGGVIIRDMMHGKLLAE